MTADPERTGARLVSASRVEGAEVYNTEGEHLGEVKDVFIDKVSGRAEFATLAFGGVLGLGERHYPVPWDALTYDPDQGGFVIGLDKEALKAAPGYEAEKIDEPAHDWHDEVRSYYAGYSLGII